MFTPSAQPLLKHPYIQKYGVVKTSSKSCQSYKDSGWLLKQTDLPRPVLQKKPEYKKSASTKTPQPEQHILPLPSLEDQL